VRIRVQWQVLVLVLVASTGCSADPDGRVDGPLLTSVGTSDDAMGALVGGSLGYERECLLLGEMPVVWPEGTRWDSARRSLRLPDGNDVEAEPRSPAAEAFCLLPQSATCSASRSPTPPSTV
jgi:hypothetical protein